MRPIPRRINISMHCGPGPRNRAAWADLARAGDGWLDCRRHAESGTESDLALGAKRPTGWADTARPARFVFELPVEVPSEATVGIPHAVRWAPLHTKQTDDAKSSTGLRGIDAGAWN